MHVKSLRVIIKIFITYACVYHQLASCPSGCPGFFPGALLTFNGAAGDVQGSLDENVMLWAYMCTYKCYHMNLAMHTLYPV